MKQIGRNLYTVANVMPKTTVKEVYDRAKIPLNRKARKTRDQPYFAITLTVGELGNTEYFDFMPGVFTTAYKEAADELVYQKGDPYGHRGIVILRPGTEKEDALIGLTAAAEWHEEQGDLAVTRIKMAKGFKNEEMRALGQHLTGFRLNQAASEFIREYIVELEDKKLELTEYASE